MLEMIRHRPGRIFLLILLLSALGVIAVILSGALEIPVLLFGWMTMPLLVGAVFVMIWLVAYLVYFFKYWPYR